MIFKKIILVNFMRPKLQSFKNQCGGSLTLVTDPSLGHEPFRTSPKNVIGPWPKRVMTGDIVFRNIYYEDPI